jgi:Molecular chaperone GrpE (heat shock protein)
MGLFGFKDRRKEKRYPMNYTYTEVKTAQPSQQESNVDYKDKYLRAMAEISNMKKQFVKDKEQLTFDLLRPILIGVCRIYFYVNKAFIYSLIKGFSRDSMRESLSIICTSILNMLNDNSVSKIKVNTGSRFDPELHEACGIISNSDVENNTVVNIMEDGFTYNDKLLKAAKVIVNKRP